MDAVTGKVWEQTVEASSSKRGNMNSFLDKWLLVIGHWLISNWSLLIAHRHFTAILLYVVLLPAVSFIIYNPDCSALRETATS